MEPLAAAFWQRKTNVTADTLSELLLLFFVVVVGFAFALVGEASYCHRYAAIQSIMHAKSGNQKAVVRFLSFSVFFLYVKRHFRFRCDATTMMMVDGSGGPAKDGAMEDDAPGKSKQLRQLL